MKKRQNVWFVRQEGLGRWALAQKNARRYQSRLF